ncbi:MAG: thioredoxin fold domain-containing protein [bacterium]|nr:thioredoxin fold domain-containing protein [bacterium]
MRHRLTFLLPAVLAVRLLLPVPAEAEIRRVPWREDPAWSDVLAAAAADSGRSILLDFHAPWCGPCRLLDAMVYNEDEVVDELADVVTVKIDIDRPENAETRARFVIERLPTLVWCAPDGQEVNRFVGYRNAAEFLDEVRRFRSLEHSSRTLASRMTADPEDRRLLLEMADLEARRDRPGRAEVLYRRAANARVDGVARTRALLGLALLAHREDRATEALSRGREASRTGAAWTEVVAFQEAVGDTIGLLETYRLRAAADDMDVVALDGYARTAVALNVEMEEASRHALRAMVLSDREPEIMATLAECYHRRGRYRKAIRWLGEALAENPDLPAPRVAAFRARLRDYEDALAKDPFNRRPQYRSNR